MKFGILFRPQDPPDAANIVQRWQEVLEAAVAAEEAGFDGVFLPEHHSVPDGYLPSAFAPLGALAAKTDRIDIGTTIALLPLHHPVTVAEATAMVDILSQGRLRFGVGLGNFAPEFDLFGLDKRTQVSRFEESIDIVRRLWAGETLDHHGKHFDIKGNITPLPVSPEMWMGAMSEPGVRRAAKFDMPWIADDIHNIEVIKMWTKMYEESCAEHGSTRRICLLRDGWVGDDMDAVERDWWPHMRSEHWFYFEKVPRWVAEFEPYLEGVETEDDFTFDAHRRDRLIVGSPQDCIDELRRFEEAIDPEYFILGFRASRGPSHEKDLECIHRFGRDVIPAFR